MHESDDMHGTVSDLLLSHAALDQVVYAQASIFWQLQPVQGEVLLKLDSSTCFGKKNKQSVPGPRPNRHLDISVLVAFASQGTLCCSELKPKHLICLGGFKNLRQDYKYEGLKMELDETSYEWGTCYEIEIETVSCCHKIVSSYFHR